MGVPYFIRLVEKCSCGKIRYIYDGNDKSAWFSPQNLTFTMKLIKKAAPGNCGCKNKK